VRGRRPGGGGVLPINEAVPLVLYIGGSGVGKGGGRGGYLLQVVLFSNEAMPLLLLLQLLLQDRHAGAPLLKLDPLHLLNPSHVSDGLVRLVCRLVVFRPYSLFTFKH